MKNLKTSAEKGVYFVSLLENERGYRPTGREHKAHCAAAVEEGYITPIKGSWGHRITGTGRAVLAGIAGRQRAKEDKLSAAGFDPKKAIADMTEEEIEAFKNYLNRGSK